MFRKVVVEVLLASRYQRLHKYCTIKEVGITSYFILRHCLIYKLDLYLHVNENIKYFIQLNNFCYIYLLIYLQASQHSRA